MAKTRWEKKVKSKYKVLNRIKKIKNTWGPYFSLSYGRLKMLGDIGCVCSCDCCKSRDWLWDNNRSKKMRAESKREIDEFWKEAANDE